MNVRPATECDLWSCWLRVAQQALRTSDANDVGKTSQLDLEGPTTRGGHAIISAPLIVGFTGTDAMLRLLDESGREHPLDRAVKSPGTHSDLPAGAFFHILSDAVAVPLPVGECEERMQYYRRERYEIARLRQSGHDGTISVTDVMRKSGLTPFRAAG
jgi:hypothetical protein